MTFDYDKLYCEMQQALGEPSSDITNFFARHSKPHMRVLDMGCGQGRDALFMARAGHDVVGVDLSGAGISCMLSDAKAQELTIVGVVADIREYAPEGLFDVILIDRTLHMLPRPDRQEVLEKLLAHVADGGHLLIADEQENLPDFAAVIAADKRPWGISVQQGSLFATVGKNPA